MNLINRIKNTLYSWHIFSITYNLIKTYFLKNFYNIFPKLKYLKDKKLCTINNVSGINWLWYSIWDFRITKFIEKRNINPHNINIDFFSVFWPKNCINYSKEIKIFFTWEDISQSSLLLYKWYDNYLLDRTNLSIGFKDFKKDNYIRFPLRIMQLIDPRMSDDDIIKRIEDINNRQIIKKKKKFCSLVARHDISWKREIVYNQLKELWRIDCPSYFKHNIDVNLPDWEAKRKFISEYRYNICLENNLSEWYVTEKLIDALLAKTIPIYYWLLNDFDKSIINEKAFIYADDQLFNKIKELESDKTKYNEMLMIKPLKENAANIIIQHLNLLENKLKYILNNEN